MDQARPGCDWFKNLSNGVGPSFSTTGCHHASDRNDRSHAVYRALSTNGESALACRTSSNCRLSNPPPPAKFLSPVTAPRAVECCLRFTVSLAVAAQDSRPSGSLLLSRKELSSSTSSRFSPAHCNRDFATVCCCSLTPREGLFLRSARLSMECGRA